jgi:thioredoxin-like negative regulator of GroEL
MAHESAASRKSPKVAAEIATRLLAAGRAEEAHAVLEAGSLDSQIKCNT